MECKEKDYKKFQHFVINLSYKEEGDYYPSF